jgi:exopolysaccharide biosynthesis polyprenyl glycosylphosphotransferase
MNATALSQPAGTERGNGSKMAPTVLPKRPRKASNNALRRAVAIGMDILLSSGAGVLAYQLHLSYQLHVSPWQGTAFLHHALQTIQGLPITHVDVFLLYLALFFLSAHSQNLYRFSTLQPASREKVLVARAVAIATVLLIAFIYLFGIKAIARFTVALTAVFSVIAMVSWRACASYLRKKQLVRGFGLQHVLIVGAGKIGQLLADHLDQNPSLGYKVKGFVDSNHHDDPRILGKVEELGQIVRQEFIDEIFVTIPSERELVKAVSREAHHFNLGLRVIPDLYDGIAWRSPEEFVGEFPVRVLNRRPVPHPSLFLKRAIDVLGSALGLLFLSPFFILISIAIKLDSPGPILYRASRAGKKGRRFVCYKFRTMVADADKQKEVLQHLNERVGPLFKISNDPRVTRLGAFLRRHSLDEFPQLWNVLNGEMSLVGPRPPEFEEITEYKLEHLSRLDTTPGITGLWQVRARHDPCFETAVALDNEYIQNWSLFLDFEILLKTIPVVLKGLGR